MPPWRREACDGPRIGSGGRAAATARARWRARRAGAADRRSCCGTRAAPAPSSAPARRPPCAAAPGRSPGAPGRWHRRCRCRRPSSAPARVSRRARRSASSARKRACVIASPGSVRIASAPRPCCSMSRAPRRLRDLAGLVGPDAERDDRQPHGAVVPGDQLVPRPCRHQVDPPWHHLQDQRTSRADISGRQGGGQPWAYSSTACPLGHMISLPRGMSIASRCGGGGGGGGCAGSAASSRCAPAGSGASGSITTTLDVAMRWLSAAIALVTMPCHAAAAAVDLAGVAPVQARARPWSAGGPTR